MTQALSFYYASIALILASMLVSGFQLSKGVHRNQSFNLMTFGSIVSFIGAGLIAICFLYIGDYFSPYRFFEELPRSIFKKLLFLGFFTFGLSLVAQPLYFKSLRGRISKKFIFISYGGVVLFYLSFILLAERGIYINRAIATNTFVSLILAWLLFECSASNKQSPSTWCRLIHPVCLIFLSLLLCWIAILIYTSVQGYFFSFTVSEISQLDISFRFLRGALFIFIQLSILMHWTENFSDNAVKVKTRDEMIERLLNEKDALIENLSNKNALVETGALSAGLAHELNQFLARIELNCGEVLDKIKRSDNNVQDIKPCMENILIANHSAANLVVSLKKLFISGNHSAASLNLDRMVEDVTALYLDRARKSNILIQLDLRANQTTKGLDSLLRQAVSNLISNAIDALDSHDRENKMIHIQSEVDSQGRYQLSITDNGLGIKQEHADRLFSIFSTFKSSGTGIGLWLSRYIAERHKGSLDFQNLNNNGGVTFFLILPLA